MVLQGVPGGEGNKLKIKQVEELVGITKKNIRFYEEQGLLEVKRAANGYREYSMKDVKRLQEIKLLRKLSVTIDDMRQIFKGGKSLKSCIEYQVEAMERQKKNIGQIQFFCEQLLHDDLLLENLDAVLCLEKMERMEKEGTNFMDIKKTDIRRKRLLGAVLGACVMVALMAAAIAFLLWASSEDPIPVGWLAFFIGLLVIVIIGIILALAGRIKEIKGGEQDEASKY